jgi:biopolymer transport protein ExbD
MTTFLNLMVVLVPFLLITAVFSRITIVELSLPSSTGNAAVSEPTFRLEVIVRDDGLELTDGSAMLASVPNVDEGYDLAKLSEHVFELKQRHPTRTMHRCFSSRRSSTTTSSRSWMRCGV